MAFDAQRVIRELDAEIQRLTKLRHAIKGDMSVEQIARIVGVEKQTVYYWIRRGYLRTLRCDYPGIGPRASAGSTGTAAPDPG